MTQYKVTPLSVSNKEAFSEASREELRVLLVLMECGGRVESTEALADLAATSRARASASLVLWEEAGVISPVSDAPTITEEFERRIESGEIDEITAKDAARSIRNEGLADMISEYARLIGRPTLNTAEIKKLTGLSEQYALSPEYILTLAAHMEKKGSLNLGRLVNRAIKLTEKDICDITALEEYLTELENESEAVYNFRKIFGITDRAPSQTEKKLFTKWSREYGYFTDIVGEAYDIAVTTANSGKAAYVDKILTHWFEAGCRTLAECRARRELDDAERRAKKEQEKPAAKSKAKPEKERYGDFDAEDAFIKALNRSYGKK